MCAAHILGSQIICQLFCFELESKSERERESSAPYI